MPSPTSPDADQDQRLNEVLLSFVEAEERGETPDRPQLIAAHPELASELAEFFFDRDRLERLTAPLRAAQRTAHPATGLSGILPEVTVDLHYWPPGQKPISNPTAASERDPELGQLGDFRLLREVGRGGMGTVYEAHQISLNRQVALKVLPLAAALDPRQLQRFKNEAMAAAHLHHPNIVPVYAVGCERGVHYYAMQLIEGQSLAALIGDLRRAGATAAPASSRALPFALAKPPAGAEETATLRTGGTTGKRTARGIDLFRRIAQLAMTAAQALEHAHQLGVVHRDIKPANLMLDSRGTLWITDFGLALLHNNNGGVTSTGELVGTLRYMSPEQAGRDRHLVDHRTDIYSLGATLFELLTVQPLFPNTDASQLLRQIADEEPRAPRSIDRTIPVELETIVLKALAKNPADRYATAQEMADDLQRFLTDQPVRARRPTLLDRSRRWARRHKAVVVSAVVLLLAATVGLGVTTILIARAHLEVKAAYDRERTKADEALEQRSRAEANFRQARRAINFFTDLTAKELVDEPNVLEARRKLLEGAIQYYQEFIDGHEDDPSIQKELAADRARVAQILSELSAPQEYLRLTLMLRLLGEEDVQKDLQIGADQRNEIAGLSAQLVKQREVFRSMRSLSEQERAGNLKEMAASNEKAVAGILTPVQLNRLKEIALQQKGPEAFSQPGVVTALSLTPAQRAAIRSAQEKTRRSLAGVLRHARRGSSDQQKAQQIWKKSAEEVLALLEPEQQTAWQKMTGKEFQGRIYPYLLTGFAYVGKAPRGLGNGRFGGDGAGRNGKGPPRDNAPRLGQP